MRNPKRFEHVIFEVSCVQAKASFGEYRKLTGDVFCNVDRVSDPEVTLRQLPHNMLDIFESSYVIKATEFHT